MSSDALDADKLADSLAAQLVKRLRDEYEVAAVDSERIASLVGEAASGLRRNLEDLSDTLGKLDLPEDEAETLRATIQRSVILLQFEDMVSQLVAHEVQRETDLGATLASVLDAMQDSAEGDNLAWVVEQILENLDEAVSSSRVHKSDLTPEEPELF